MGAVVDGTVERITPYGAFLKLEDGRLGLVHISEIDRNYVKDVHDPAHRELRAADLDAVREQIGREPTTPFTVVARCSGGHPFVIRDAPFDASGEPFPTTYWLTCPAAVKAVSRLEAGGAIARMN